MVGAAREWLAALDPQQRKAATAPFDVDDRRVWTYLPGRRIGLALAEMTAEQQALALALVDAGCSVRGARTARAIVVLDEILRGAPKAGEYWLRVLGEPGGAAPWAWRVGGHHLALHLTVVGDAVAATPQFFGAEPAVVLHGTHQGLRTLPAEEELARELLASLDAPQQEVAIAAAVAPADILTRYDPVADPGLLSSGLSYADMHGGQCDLLRRLVRLYFDRVPDDVAERSWRQAVDAGLEAVSFRWAGGMDRGVGHYYAVAGPTFLLEYDNTQDDANHIHSVWRDLGNDWGEDLLAAHYAAAHV